MTCFYFIRVFWSTTHQLQLSGVDQYRCGPQVTMRQRAAQCWRQPQHPWQAPAWRGPSCCGRKTSPTVPLWRYMR